MVITCTHCNASLVISDHITRTQCACGTIMNIQHPQRHDLATNSRVQHNTTDKLHVTGFNTDHIRAYRKTLFRDGSKLRLGLRLLRFEIEGTPDADSLHSACIAFALSFVRLLVVHQQGECWYTCPFCIGQRWLRQEIYIGTPLQTNSWVTDYRVAEHLNSLALRTQLYAPVAWSKLREFQKEWLKYINKVNSAYALPQILSEGIPRGSSYPLSKLHHDLIFKLPDPVVTDYDMPLGARILKQRESAKSGWSVNANFQRRIAPTVSNTMDAFGCEMCPECHHDTASHTLPDGNCVECRDIDLDCHLHQARKRFLEFLECLRQHLFERVLNRVTAQMNVAKKRALTIPDKLRHIPGTFIGKVITEPAYPFDRSSELLDVHRKPYTSDTDHLVDAFYYTVVAYKRNAQQQLLTVLYYRLLDRAASLHQDFIHTLNWQSFGRSLAWLADVINVIIRRYNPRLRFIYRTLKMPCSVCGVLHHCLLHVYELHDAANNVFARVDK